MRWLLILPAWLLLILATSGALAQEGDPGLTVTAPKGGAELKESSVTVEFEVTDFEIVRTSVPLTEAGKRPEANRPGEGHLHLRLDLQPVVVWEKDEPYTFENVAPGEHVLMVELANNDHSSLSPPVMQQIRFQSTGPEAMPATGSETILPLTFTLIVLGVLLLSAGRLIRRRRYA